MQKYMNPIHQFISNYLQHQWNGPLTSRTSPWQFACQTKSFQMIDGCHPGSVYFLYYSSKIQQVLRKNLFFWTKLWQESHQLFGKSYRLSLLIFNGKSSWCFALNSQSGSIHSSKSLHSRHLISKQLLQSSLPVASVGQLQLRWAALTWKAMRL